MEPIELLEKLVSINSVFPNEAELTNFLADELRKRGFEVNVCMYNGNRYNVLATRGTRGKFLLLYAHMDTVPPYDYESTGRDSFELVEKDGKLYGLGAYDMKAGIAAILKAVENIENDRAIKIMFVSDEEADSQGCYEVTKTDFLKDVEFALATEISDVSDVNQKTKMITLGRRGRVQYEITIPGKSYHAAKMENGISAITEASKLAIEIEKMNTELPQHEKLSHGNQFVRKFFSESVSLSIPDRAVLLVDRHLVLPETAESARNDIERKINQLYADGTLKNLDEEKAKVIIKPREVPYLMPYVTQQNNSHVQRLNSVIREKLDVDASYNCGLSVADENLIAMQGIPIVTYGPIGSGEHSNGEWVSKQSFLEMIEVLKTFVES
ncbi:MAG: M20/M25/M40 family metallo-hydrolase [Candidatus Micrarchaeota archaeon]